MRPLRILLWLLLPASLSAHDSTEPNDEAEPSRRPSEPTLSTNKQPLRIRLVDEDTGLEIPGCIRISVSGRKSWLDLSESLLPRALGIRTPIQNEGWHVLTEPTVLSLPPGQLTLEAFSGIEYLSTAVTKSVVPSTESLNVPLRRLFNAASQGWVAGNTHLHLRKLTRSTADRYLTEVSHSDGLSVVFVSYLERALVDRDYTSNVYTNEDLRRLSTPRLLFGDGEEYRHNFGPGGEGYGHVMLLELTSRILPASLGPGITQMGNDSTPLLPGVQQARGQGATIIWCHNHFGMEDLPNWLLGTLHAQNIFDGGSRGSYEDSFYRYLNLGLQVPFSTGTDWFLYDFSRVYVSHPNEIPLTSSSWLEKLRAGHSIITNGPWIELKLHEASPGDRISLETPIEFPLHCLAKSRHDFAALELIQNGKVIHSSPAERTPQGGFQASFKQASLPIDHSSWIAARIRPRDNVTNELQQPLFAHTSPIYLTLQGRQVFDPITAQEVRQDLEESMTRIATHGAFPNATERDQVLAIYRQGLQALTRLGEKAGNH